MMLITLLFLIDEDYRQVYNQEISQYFFCNVWPIYSNWNNGRFR